jgi:hypothetical protein
VPGILAIALLLLAACWDRGVTPSSTTAPVSKPAAAQHAPAAQITLERDGKLVALESSGVGQVDPNRLPAEAYFLVAPDEVTRFMRALESARFRDMPSVFGLPYRERMMPFDCAREQCDRTPPPGTTKPPRYRLELRVGDVTHSVTQSAEGEHSKELETLVNDFTAMCDAARRDHPLPTTLTLQEELDLIRDRVLPPAALHVTGGHNRYDNGLIVDGWSIVIDGTNAVVTKNPSNEKEFGQLTSGEYKLLRNVLASVPLPYMAYAHVPADNTHWFLWARVMHRTSINSNSGSGVDFDPGVQQAFERAFAVLETAVRRITKANGVQLP